MLFANGIGPIKRAINRHCAGRTLNGLDAISLRDSESYQEIKALGISKPNIYVTSDPAILMEPSDKACLNDLMAKERIPQDKSLVGFSIRKWADSNYLDQIAKIADYCVEHYGLHPVFMPMQYPSDYEISQSIRARMENSASVIEGMYRPEVMLGFTGRLELLVGMRLHSLIYAASQGIPLTGLVYEPKVGAFLKEIGQPSAGHLEKLESDLVCRVLDEVWENREKIREQLRESKKRLVYMAKSNIEIAYRMLKSNTDE